MNSVATSINARCLAQEIAAQYFANYDPYESHRSNTSKCLLAPVTAVTINLLTNAHGEVEALKASDHAAAASADTALINHTEEESKQKEHQNGDSGKATWQDPLAAAGQVVERNLLEADLSKYKGLHRRSKARMEAFLEGIALAVASSGSKPIASATEDKPKPDISLEDGLTGYSVKDGGENGSRMIKSLNNSGRSLFRSLSSTQSTQKKSKQEQLEEIDLITRLELYIRCLCRVKTQGNECVLAAEPPRALKARAQAIVASFVGTVSTVRQQSPILTRLLVHLSKELLAVEYLSPDLLQTIRRLVSDYEQQTSFASLAFLSTPDDSADQRLTPMIVRYMKFLQASWRNYVADCELERMLTLSLDKEMRKTFKTIEFTSIGHLLETCAMFRPQLHKIELAPMNLGDSSDHHKLIDDPDVVHQAIRDLQRERITVNGHLLPPVTSRKELIHLLQQTMNSRTLTALPLKSRRRNRRRRKGVDDPDQSASSESDLTSAAESDAGGRGTSREQQPHRRNFHVSTIDVLTKRLLVAASRTGTGGDAFFVVRDLFGGDEVEVIPSEVLPTHGRAVRPGTIEILVRLASVTIKCHASFDVYPKGMVRACEPLIQLHTTTTETISLQEVRASDSMEANDHPDDYETDQSGKSTPNAFMVLQEREIDKSGWRTLAIRPALYEKVESWNTPS